MPRNAKVGLFVLAGIVVLMIFIVLIGNTTQLWEPRATFRTAFGDVAGLKPGAPVRMGGLDIGQVTAVGHDGDSNDARIFVTLSITKKEAVRIRTDSVAHVGNKGLLGDKMIELTAGSQAAPQPPEKLIGSEEPSDVPAAANKMAAQAEKEILKLEPLAQALGDPKFAADIEGSAADVHGLLDAIVHGDGAMHGLFFDHAESEQLNALLANASRTTQRLDATLTDVQALTEQAKAGPGIAHALLYDGEISKDAAGVLSEIHQDLAAIRTGNGFAHSVVYGDSTSQHALANLDAMTDDLRVIVSGLRQGKGTLGALLVDPTVYEDLKSAIGNVERNQVLRAIVRYSIKADEQRPAPKVDAK